MPRRKTHKNINKAKILLKDLKYKINWLFHRNAITRKEYEKFSNDSILKPLAELLSTGQSYKMPSGNIEMIPLTLREFDGTEFPFVLITAQEFIRPRNPKKKLKCFIGHRFKKIVTDNLRHNLASVFDCFGITPDYSDTGYQNGQVFNTIISKIKAANFRIFDNRLTEHKPNVYIEIGAAIILKKPYYFFEFKDTKEGVPSDLHGLLTLRYSNYKELFHEFSLTFPDFIETYKL